MVAVPVSVCSEGFMRIRSLHASISVSERFRRLSISAFVVLSLFCVLLSNRPPRLIDWEEGALDSIDPNIAYEARNARWLVEEYAFFAGLNNRWQMFGRQSRFNWWFTIEATYGNGSPILLPVPGQTERSLWRAALFDFKETKLALNLYGDPQAREAYARYLARQYPERDGQPIRAIAFLLHWQPLRSREEASATGTYLGTLVSTQVMQRVAIQP